MRYPTPLHPATLLYKRLTHPTDLSAAVDVYCDWLDACEAVADKEAPEPVGGAMQMRGGVNPAERRPKPRIQTGGGEEDDLDGFIENDEEDAEAGYTGTAR